MTSFAPEHYKETLLFLGTAGLVVPIFRRLKISPILGFLAAGVCLGPYGLGSLHIFGLPFLGLGNIEAIEAVAEFGVVFLLFMIGLELSWERLAHMRRWVFGFGALQVFTSAAILGAFAFILHEGTTAALVIGFGLALSSTAIVIPVLAEQKRLGSGAGRTIFSVLLFQDLMVAPLLFMISMLGRGGPNLGSSFGPSLAPSLAPSLGMAAVSTLLPALLALSVIVLGGRLVLRPLFHHVAAAGSTEFFIAACLFVVIGTGVLTAMSGLSMGLGAFIAGLLLAETEYRREIEVTIEPFKGLLLGLFFVSVGASLDLRQVIAAPERTLGFAAAFMLIKFIVIWLIGRLMRLSSVVAAETALLLAPGGEFAFVMITAAVTLGSIPAAAGAHVMIAVTLSMFTVPLLAALAKALPRPKLVADPELEAVPALDAASHPVIIAGYGRVGQLIGDMLRQKDIPFLAVDGSVKIVKTFRRAGVPIYWGNAERPDFLVRCGLAQARALVVTLDASQASEAIVRFARAAHPDLTIVARARDAAHATHLYELGVSDAVPETVEASLQLAEAVLVDLGIPMGHVIAAVHEKRDEFRKILQPAAGRAAERRGVKLSARVRDIHRRQRLAADE